MLKSDGRAGVAQMLEHVQGPDFPGGGQIISSTEEIAEVYVSGRGSIKVRARWKIEELARGQWQLVVTELPPGVSARQVREEIEELTNPKLKVGRKSLSAEQLQTRQLVLSVLDKERDESGREAAVRLVFEPKSRTVDQGEFVNLLLSHTSLESSCPINLVMIGADGRPQQKNLAEILREWVEFRRTVVTRRTRDRLSRTEDRIHVLEGRLLVLLNIDRVIAIIRGSDEPKPALITAFRLSERQAEDILEIRLRQLARLEGIRLEQELSELRAEEDKLKDLLANPASLKRLLVREIEADEKEFADTRRTLIEADRRATLEVKVVDEPVSVVFSERGWVRARAGHGHDVAQFSFKSGDSLYDVFECRTVDLAIALGSNGRVYSVPVAQLPGARGDGVPITSLIDLEAGTHIAHLVAGARDLPLLLATSGGYGFVCKLGDLVSRQRGGKTFLTLEAGELPLRPRVIDVANHTQIACLAEGARVLVFPSNEIKMLAAGGRGVILQELESGEKLIAALPIGERGVIVSGVGRSGKQATVLLSGGSLAAHLGKRARKGKKLAAKFTPQELIAPAARAA
jgi:topoisomerase-4 subunit A